MEETVDYNLLLWSISCLLCDKVHHKTKTKKCGGLYIRWQFKFIIYEHLQSLKITPHSLKLTNAIECYK